MSRVNPGFIGDLGDHGASQRDRVGDEKVKDPEGPEVVHGHREAEAEDDREDSASRQSNGPQAAHGHREDLIEQQIKMAVDAADKSNLTCLQEVVKDVHIAYEDARIASEPPKKDLSSRAEAVAAAKAMTILIEAEQLMGDLRRFYRKEKAKLKKEKPKPDEKIAGVRGVLDAIDDVFASTRKGRHEMHPMIQQDLRCSGFVSIFTMFLTTFAGSLGTYILIPGRFNNNDTALKMMKANIACFIGAFHLVIFMGVLLRFLIPWKWFRKTKCGCSRALDYDNEGKKRGSVCCTFKAHEEVKDCWKKWEHLLKLITSVLTIFAYMALIYVTEFDFDCIVSITAAAGGLLAIAPTNSRYKKSNWKLLPFLDSESNSSASQDGGVDSSGAEGGDLIFFYD